MIRTDPPAAGLRRVQRGRNHTYELDGRDVMGVTTILSLGVPKPALVPWASRTCAEYVVDHWTDLVDLAPSARLAAVRAAPNADRDRAARRGTEVHDLAHRLSLGQDVAVPDELAGHVDAYLRFVDQWQPRELLAEAPVANRAHWWAGTLDVVAEMADQTWLIDFKTARSGIFPETGLQLAAYSRAEFAVVDQVERPMPGVDRAAAVWLRGDGTYELIPVATGDREYQTFRHAARVAWWARHHAPGVVGEPLTPADREELAS